MRTKIPVYEQIAIDIANRIYNEKYKVGQKVHGRSTLASEYNVSPETVRKALKILEDVEIVKSEKGAGVVISSRENALAYINRFSNLESAKDMEKQIRRLIEERKELDMKLSDKINQLIELSGKYRHTNPLAPIEVEITKVCKHIGKTVSDLKFWQYTGGTIVGLKREGELILSPGPYATIREGDVLLIIGTEQSYHRVLDFLNE
ncbi:GntR family transcriptional regulator [Bacillus sp. FJAT-27225]|uniref:TrkA C-terminal domain-containing protein n=1 Tax=Bacillus sp. FJAT-27225 TaxID=1743144 RepID=UPI00080C253F|nr:TrkA C-terminal domain-containing protein [Bacillus sp. FJAT-27225]OCA85741.1 GntR family transcriptional regulator [Bacillus sp. FJAT-27225]